MRQRLLEACARLAIHHPKRVLIATVFFTLAGASALPGLEIDAGHSALMNAESPHIVRAHRFMEDFGATGQLVAVVEGGDEAARRRLSDAMADQLPGEDGEGECAPEAGPRAPGCVSGVVGRVDVDALLSHALLYLSEEQLGEIALALGDASGGLKTLESAGSLTGMLTGLTEVLEERSETMDASEADSEQARAGTRALAGLLTIFQARLSGDPPTSSLREDLMKGVDRGEAQASDLQKGIDDRGYLSSKDGSVKLVMISPANESDDPRLIAPFVSYVESQTARLVAEIGKPCPAGACDDGPLRVAFTGMPAIIADEARSIQRDLTRTTIIATL
ncbi:MAG: hypothetical protein VX938_07995, partial [Myxococcota bacterium]|nr:hypothetical protein [Myxococcota bacterium]